MREIQNPRTWLEYTGRDWADCSRVQPGMPNGLSDIGRRFEAAMDELPPDYREVIVLSRIVGLDHAAIAAEMGRAETATRALLSRALGRLPTLMDRPA